VLVGSEANGLSSQALHFADLAVRIPMAAGIDSLNVAAAAAIALHRLFGPPRDESVTPPA
jgi:tRNA G18 (ribose-2'-O)-methylase SpoU